MIFSKSKIAAMSFVIATTGGVSVPSFAQEEVIEEIVTIGSRRQGRSAADTPAPVDVISGSDLAAAASTDISDLIRTAVPSYQVNTQPISDAATVVRPANLRGLSPDHTLVLLNGKRRHRAAVISFLGGGLSDGAHGPDIGVFPALGLRQVEVLRDGASSQYGSDAIAGVINFALKDSPEGGSIEARWGSTYEGDGDTFRIAANQGFALGNDGFVNVTAEFGESDGTFRSVQRDDAAALIAAGNTAVANVNVNTQTAESAQYWGQPDVSDDVKLFINSGFQLSENVEAYAWGNYAQKETEGGFFYRNPTNRGGVYAGPSVDAATGAELEGGVASVLVGDLSGATAGDCPAGIPLTSGGGLIPDPAILAQVQADPNCFSFVELFPGGFTPRFGAESEDVAFVVGFRGEFNNGLTYDVSYSYGQNTQDFFIRNTINASLGPNTPTDFDPGQYEQTDNNINVDFTYALPVASFASDLGIAFGFEFRDEEFTIDQGEAASFEIGPLSAPSVAFPTGQRFSSSSNGFGGFTQAISESQDNTAVYLELEAEVIDALTLQGAIRFEDFNTFGSTTNYKLGGLYRVTDSWTVRSTFSTGFHAPTTGQANVTNVTTQFVGTQLVDQGVLPLTSAAGQFVNDQLGGQFTLGPEDSENFSIGTAFEIGTASITLDYFRVEVEDRIALSEEQDFIGLLNQAAASAGVAVPAGAATSQVLNALGAAGILNPAAFIGSEDLTSFQFFTNDFDTRTQGVDVVASFPIDIGSGSSSLAFAFNYTDTEVTRRGGLGDLRIRQIEENLPNVKGNVTFKHSADKWRFLARANYHSDYFEAHLDSSGLEIFPGSELTFDVEAGYSLSEKLDLTFGVTNLFDEFPDENEFGGIAGARFPATAPFGFTGGQYYLKASYNF